MSNLRQAARFIGLVVLPAASGYLGSFVNWHVHLRLDDSHT